MLDYLDLGAVRLASTSTTDVQTVTGLTGIPSVRGATFDRPEANGVVEPLNQYFGPRIIVIEGEAWGATIDLAWAQWNTIQQTLAGAVTTPALLKFRRGGGTLDLQVTVRTINDAYARLDANAYGPSMKYQATLRAADPYLYAQTSQSVAASAPSGGGGMPLPVVFPIVFGAGTAGGTAAAQTNGNAAAWPLLTITGPVNGPLVGNASTGQFLYFDTLSLAVGDTLIIDTNPATRSATVAGASKLGALRFSDSVWPSMTPGASETWQFYGLGGGTTGSSTLTVAWRDTYIS